MQTFDITKEEYISVLETEVDTLLLRQYYNPEIEGTGHFRTASSVLQMRIDELKSQL